MKLHMSIKSLMRWFITGAPVGAPAMAARVSGNITGNVSEIVPIPIAVMDMPICDG
jgi:hypothetical protein